MDWLSIALIIIILTWETLLHFSLHRRCVIWTIFAKGLVTNTVRWLTACVQWTWVPWCERLGVIMIILYLNIQNHSLLEIWLPRIIPPESNGFLTTTSGFLLIVAAKLLFYCRNIQNVVFYLQPNRYFKQNTLIALSMPEMFPTADEFVYIHIELLMTPC